MNTVTKPLAINFRSNYTEMLEQLNLSHEDFNDLPYDIVFCENFKELSSEVIKDPEIIIIGGIMITAPGSFSELSMMLDILCKHSGSTKKPKIIGCINKNTTLDIIKEMKRSGVIGIIPSMVSFGIDSWKRGLKSINQPGGYWAKEYYPTAKLQTELAGKLKDIHLTNRQREVYDLISKRGLSNKQIAKVLSISESTVKIHVSAIMKSFCVRNRTQLALTK